MTREGFRWISECVKVIITECSEMSQQRMVLMTVERTECLVGFEQVQWDKLIRWLVGSFVPFIPFIHSFIHSFIFHTTTEHYLHFSCPHLHVFKHFASNPDFHFTILSRRLSSLSAVKIKSSAYSNSRGKPAHSSLKIISITITNSRGLNTYPWYNPTFTLNALLSPVAQSHDTMIKYIKLYLYANV